MVRTNDKTIWDPTLTKFLECMANSGQVKVKQAAEVGTRRVDYFRGADFVKWAVQNRHMLQNKFQSIFENRGATSQSEILEVGQQLIRKGFISRAHYQPFEGTEESTTVDGQLRRPKWPKRLAISPKQTFDENQFYIVHYDGGRWRHYIVMVGILIGVLGVCMFNAWPIFAKIAIWYLTVAFMTLSLSICAVRLVVFLFLWFLGCDCWIFPNLFDEERGFFDSFRPTISFERRNDGWWMMAARGFCAALFAACIIQLGRTHTVADVGQFTRQSFLDIVEWGKHKITALPEPKNLYPSITDIESQTAEDDKTTYHDDEEDWKCLSKCGYTTFEQVMESCLINCQCIAWLLNKEECIKECPITVTAALMEYQHNSCR